MSDPYLIQLTPDDDAVTRDLAIQRWLTAIFNVVNAGGGGGGGGTWGSITGTLSNQTDLNAALNARGLTSSPLSQFASTTSAQLASVLSNSTGTGLAVFNANPTLAGFTLTAAPVYTPTPMGALAVNVALPVNMLSISADHTITFTPTDSPTVGTRTILEVSNTDSSKHTLTLPIADTIYSVNRSSNITAVSVPATATMVLTFENTGTATWNIYNDPVATSGTGNTYPLTTLPTFLGIINSAASINTGAITASISGDTEDWSPTGWLSSNTAQTQEIQVTSSVAMARISGLVAPSTSGQIAGPRVKLANYGTKTILLKDQASGLSTSGNRFAIGGYDIPLWPNDEVELQYDLNNTCWRIINSATKVGPPTRRYGFYAGRSAFPGTLTADQYLNAASITSTGTDTATVPDGYFLNSYIHGATTAAASAKCGFGASAGMLISSATYPGYWRSTYIVRLPQAGSSAATDFYMRIGWADSTTGSAASNGVYIAYDYATNSGNYVLHVSNAASDTSKGLSVGPPVSATVPFRVDIDVTQTLVEVYQNGTLIGSQTTVTNLPTNPVGPMAYIITGSSGSTNDLFDIGAIEVLNYVGTP